MDGATPSTQRWLKSFVDERSGLRTRRRRLDSYFGNPRCGNDGAFNLSEWRGNRSRRCTMDRCLVRRDIRLGNSRCGLYLMSELQ